MTRLLEQVFARAAELPEAEQDAIAARLLEEILSDDAWDARLEQTADALSALAARARAAHAAGETDPIDPPAR